MTAPKKKGAPKKRGPKPRLWTGLPGEKFANAVYDLQAQRRAEGRPISTAAAIRKILKRPEFADFRKYKTKSPREFSYLEKQILVATQHWKPGQGFGWHSQLTEPVRTPRRR